MLVFTNPQFSGHRPYFVEAFPEVKDDHRRAQASMFATAREVGLPTQKDEDREAMIEGINELLGLKLHSRRQLTVEEMQAVKIAIESGAFQKGWKLSGAFRVVFSMKVEISIEAIPSA